MNPTLGVAVNTPLPSAKPNKRPKGRRPRAPQARGTRQRLMLMRCGRDGASTPAAASNPTPTRGKVRPTDWMRKATVTRAAAPARVPATYAPVALKRSRRPRPEGATIA
jgi:hypothetical protein